MPASYLPSRTLNFVGREHILNEIEETFLTEKKQIIVLTSFAGTGKSTVANEFGYRFKDLNKNCYSYWMKSDETNLHTEYSKLAKYMNIKCDASQSTDDLIRNINSKIHHLDDNIKILLILDNCDSYAYIENYIKNVDRNVFILITTRDKSFEENLGENAHSYELEPFEPDECIRFMQKSLGKKSKNENELKDLLELTGLSNQYIRPYVLNKLVGLVKLETKLKTLNSLINDYKTKKKDDFTRKIIQDDELYDRLHEKEPNSWKLLKYSSFLDPDFIPIEIFTEMLNINENELICSLDTLTKLSMVVTYEDENMVGLRVHRTTQQEIKQYLKFKYENEINIMMEQFGFCLKDVFNNDFVEIRRNGHAKRVYYYNFKKLIETILNSNNSNPPDNVFKSDLGHKFGDYRQIPFSVLLLS